MDEGVWREGQEFNSTRTSGLHPGTAAPRTGSVYTKDAGTRHLWLYRR